MPEVFDSDYEQNTNGVMPSSHGQATRPMAGLDQRTNLDTSLKELETQSWINWEAFVQDIGDTNQLSMLERWS